MQPTILSLNSQNESQILGEHQKEREIRWLISSKEARQRYADDISGAEGFHYPLSNQNLMVRIKICERGAKFQSGDQPRLSVVECE